MNPMEILGMAQSFIGAGLLLSAKRPKYEIPGSFESALNISQMQTQNDMPGMEQGLDLASLASANAINAAQGTGNAASMIPAVVAQQNAQQNQLIAQNLWDEARVFVNPTKYFTQGIKAPDISLSNANKQNSGTDILYTIKNPKQ